MTWASVNRVFFIGISSFILPRKFYFRIPLRSGGITEPALHARQIERKQMKLAMSFGNRHYYRIDQIHRRHFLRTAVRAGLSKKLGPFAICVG